MGFISWVKGAGKKVGKFAQGAAQKVGEFAKKVPGAVQKVGKFASDVAGKVGDVAHWINTNPAAQAVLDVLGTVPVVGSVARGIQTAARRGEQIAGTVKKGGEFAQDVGKALQSGDIGQVTPLYERGRSLYSEAKGLRNN